MAAYIVHNRLAGTQQVNTTTFKTQTAIHAVTANLRRAEIYDLEFGADDAPNATDCQIVYDVSRTTGVGTGTAATPTKKDPADAASDMVGTVNFTGEPTVTAASSLFACALNQRASRRWVAGPGQELIIPAVDVNGLAGRSLSPTFIGKTFFQFEFRDR